MNLLELQREVAGAIMTPARPRRAEAGAWLKPNARLTSLERLEIYRRSYWSRLLDSLKEDFPGLCAMLGARKFHRLAEAYLSDEPSASFTMRNLGSRLEAWLGEHAELVGTRIGIALDMARVEWAQVEAFDAMARQPLGPEDLAEIEPDLKLRLQPHLQLLGLQYPVDDWRNQLLEGSKARRTLQPEPIWLAVHRADFEVYYRRLDAEEFRILRALRDGASIADAVDATSAPERIEEWFGEWAAMGWLCQRGQEPE